jgi:nucleoid DNA-binding protein
MIFLKSDIVNHLAEKFPYHKKKDIEEVIIIIIESLTNSLKNNERIEIRGLGSFEIRGQKIKEFINPKTQKVSVSKKNKKVYFKVSSDLKNL